MASTFARSLAHAGVGGVIVIAVCLASPRAHAETETPPAPSAAPAPAALATPAPAAPCPCVPVPSPPSPPPKKHFIEVTFGNSQLFAHQSFIGKSGTRREEVIPVTSALLQLEWLLHGRLAALSFINFPLATQKILVDGVVEEKFVAPSVALGLRVSTVRLEVFNASVLELQLAALGGITIGSQGGDRAFPLIAGRLHFSNPAGFALYIGSAFAFQKDTLALFYGIGHRF